ncbi:hypothetical protein CCR75_008589 [Bremia lactucae]|uniref:Uncharacterized protein n=1 Tax=Bremia lactucae TaxID=4779 RepID=A0A976IFG6_BRELC|nr:hypothetical protein CCR75_008589 [Bremia lactucae]
MRMLATSSPMHETDHLRLDHSSHVVRIPSVSSDPDKGDDDLDDNIDELDPVDGFPSPPTRMRPRRRFVKSGVTTYELSFSRRHARRVPNSNDDGSDDFEPDEYHPALPGIPRPSPVVSSLSSVLTEVMTGKTQALNNIVDTTPPQSNVTYVVEHAPDGTPYVAASDGNKYFENSTIGQIFLKSKGVKVKAQDSDVNFSQSGGWSSQQQSTRRPDIVDEATTLNEEATLTDVDAKKGSKLRLGFKGFHISKKKKGAASEVPAGHEKDAAVLNTFNGFSSLDIDKNPTDLSPADTEMNVPHEPLEQHPMAIRLLDSCGMQSAQQARHALLVDAEMTNPSVFNSSSTSSIKALPRLQPKADLSQSALPVMNDANDDDDNLLCRSFQNVRYVDFKRSSLISDEDQEENGHDDEHLNDHEEHRDPDEHDNYDEQDDVAAQDGRIRVSSSATSVAEFIGGFKGQLSRRSGANGLINRKRAVRHARLTAAEQKAADFARKIREARNRIPPEFRVELQKKNKWQTATRHVHFNTDVLVREFEFESEDEDDGYNSPDEIVDAVQLVSKRDAVHAEDVVAVVPMEQLELPLELLQTVGNGFPSPPASDSTDEATENVQDNPLTFSQLKNDMRMSFSDL